MTAIQMVGRHSRRTPRFMVRNERWIREVREKRPLWTEWAKEDWTEDLPEEEQARRTTRGEPGDAEDEWTSAYSAI
jgi:hypothetical protein